jgi:hypothetical protein
VIIPVATAQLLWVRRTVGAGGVEGWTLMTKFDDAGEIHPAASVTVKLYVPATSPDMFVLEPVPLIAPGLTVQLPAGNPLSMTLPVAKAHVGCIIVPKVGAEGGPGIGLITTFAEAEEEQPAALVTMKLYVPGVSPVTVVLEPVPVITPGLIVQLPAGKLFRTTLPVGVRHVGCVVVPIDGTEGTGSTVNE